MIIPQRVSNCSTSLFLFQHSLSGSNDIRRKSMCFHNNSVKGRISTEWLSLSRDGTNDIVSALQCLLDLIAYHDIKTKRSIGNLLFTNWEEI